MKPNYPGVGISSAMALMLGMRHAKRLQSRQPTPEQIAAADKRTELKRWNDAVDARKAEKKLAAKHTKNMKEPE